MRWLALLGLAACDPGPRHYYKTPERQVTMCHFKQKHCGVELYDCENKMRYYCMANVQDMGVVK